MPHRFLGVNFSRFAKCALEGVLDRSWIGLGGVLGSSWGPSGAFGSRFGAQVAHLGVIFGVFEVLGIFFKESVAAQVPQILILLFYACMQM